MNRDFSNILREISGTLGNFGKRIRTLEARIKAPLPVLRYHTDVGDRVHYNYFLSPRGTHFDDPNYPLLQDFSWAGSPFVIPTSFAINRSQLQIFCDAVSGGRAFLYRPVGSAIFSMPFKASTIAGHSTTIPIAVGARVDDGTDNNYVEVVLVAAQTGSLPYYQYNLRTNTGGSKTNTALLQSVGFIWFTHVMLCNIEGTPWSNWGLRPILDYPGGGLWLQNATGRTWTPTRQGIIFDANTNVATWNRMNIDAWGSNYYE